MKYLILLTILFHLAGCSISTNDHVNSTYNKLEKIYSPKIIFDKYYSFSNHLYDLESKFNQSPKPKILVYIDSSGCTNCRIYNLRSWKNYLKDIKPPIDIVYLFQTQDISTLKKTLFLVKLDTTSIYYDIHNNFENKNTFIKKCGFNTFLLDKDNRIILAGSPYTISNYGNYTKTLYQN